MKTQLFILGFLLRHGPLESGNLEQLVDEDSPDLPGFRFSGLATQLDQLERKGFIEVFRSQGAGRESRVSFSITEEGRQAFIKMLESALAKDYESEFLLDAVFIFGDAIPMDLLLARLGNKKKFLETALIEFRKSEPQLLGRFTDGNEVMARAVFRHHEMHYEAEIAWLRETIMDLQGEQDRRKR